MNHGSKQFLAWIAAFGMSGVIFGGVIYGFKRPRIANEHASQEEGEHHDEDHDSSHEPKSDTHDSHEAESEAESDTHKSEHDDSHDANTHHDSDTHKPASKTKPDTHKSEHHDSDTHKSTPKAKPSSDHHQKPKKEEHAPKKDLEDLSKSGHSAHSPEESQHKEHADQHKTKKTASTHQTHWNYNKLDAGGPSHWGELADQFSLCEKGTEQSPIDIRGAKFSGVIPKLKWNYSDSALKIENNGHTIQATIQNQSNHILIDGQKYQLAQFHFHAPSEHQLDGIPSDMELHFVHKNDKGQLAVVGVMIHENAGKENRAFKPLWDVLPRDLNSKAEKSPSLKLAQLLPSNPSDYFYYQGSLTTPPCAEGVRWFVLKEATTLSSGQLEMFTSIFDGSTNRPVQPLLGREIQKSSQPNLAH